MTSLSDDVEYDFDFRWQNPVVVFDHRYNMKPKPISEDTEHRVQMRRYGHFRPWTGIIIRDIGQRFKKRNQKLNNNKKIEGLSGDEVKIRNPCKIFQDQSSRAASIHYNNNYMSSPASQPTYKALLLLS